MSRMLLCEPQVDLAVAMVEFFSSDNYTIDLEPNGLRALEFLRQRQYDVIILALALPGLDGISLVKGYRSGGGTAPILIISGKECSQEKQDSLDAGADAYLSKPFQLSDLSAQLRALLRRPSLRSEKILCAGNVALDTESGTVTKNDIPVHLFPMEFKLLQFLLRHPNQVFDAHAIFERVWQKGIGHAEDTVRTHIRTLRRKLDTDGGPSVITTVRGIGYKCSGH